jgi:hypothetical protein
MQRDTLRIIELNQVEQMLVQTVAEMRDASHANGGTGKVGPQSSACGNVNGFGAELAACKYLNCYPDLEIGFCMGGADCDARGIFVDVKNTLYPNGHLIAVATKRHGDADVYALMVGEFPRYRFAGCMSAAELFREERRKEFGYGPTPAAKQEELLTWEEITLADRLSDWSKKP